MEDVRVSNFQKAKRLCSEPKIGCGIPWSSGLVEFGDERWKVCWLLDPR